MSGAEISHLSECPPTYDNLRNLLALGQHFQRGLPNWARCNALLPQYIEPGRHPWTNVQKGAWHLLVFQIGYRLNLYGEGSEWFRREVEELLGDGGPRYESRRRPGRDRPRDDAADDARPGSP